MIPRVFGACFLFDPLRKRHLRDQEACVYVEVVGAFLEFIVAFHEVTMQGRFMR